MVLPCGLEQEVQLATDLLMRAVPELRAAQRIIILQGQALSLQPVTGRLQQVTGRQVRMQKQRINLQKPTKRTRTK